MDCGQCRRQLHAAGVLGLFVTLATATVGLSQRVPELPEVESFDEVGTGARRSGSIATLLPQDAVLYENSEDVAVPSDSASTPSYFHVESPSASVEAATGAVGEVVPDCEEQQEQGDTTLSDHDFHSGGTEQEGLPETEVAHQHETEEQYGTEGMPPPVLPPAPVVHPRFIAVPGPSVPVPFFSLPDIHPDQVVYILRVQGSGDFDISFEVGRAVKQLEAIKKAYREATGKLEADELESERGPAVSPRRRLVDLIKDNQRRLRAALQKIKIQKKLEEIDDLLQLTRALKAMDARLRACQDMAPIEEALCHKTKAFGEMVSQKAKEIREKAASLSSLLGVDAVEKQLRRVEPEHEDNTRVEARVEELQKALEKAASEAKQLVGTAAGEIEEGVKADTQAVQDSSKDVLTKSQLALVEAFKAIQRALLEAKTKELVEPTSKEAEEARQILAEQAA
ncbi:MAG1 protein [Toxoplasma gondii TgCatPRC2]|uniref:MAG1 protein n=2 Tax=Toxoplasma gondii TaxID=5811 RepID=A0A151HNW5_TOXGO|nr:MAG1 [Toxoplasma gondii ME49]EPT28403.1 MAG1 [Toxoplasma gondii ME49]KYK71022.1 MAG1 protein [Toxoplasma gondii TgCatPRC2]|eukprot:XP_002365700.1 MAG1 [Toxoplasma gondii ME49]